MSIGSQTMYGVTNVLWENDAVYGTDQWGDIFTGNLPVDASLWPGGLPATEGRSEAEVLHLAYG